MRFHAVLLAAATLPLAMSAAAAPVTGGANAATRYVRARAADADGLIDVAAKGYAAALDASPRDPVLARRTYRQAMVAGDQALAKRAAAVLAAKDALPPDAELLMVVDAVQRGQWAAADAAVAKVEGDELFAFLAPVMRAWIAFGAGDKDPLAKLAVTGKGGSLAIAYAGEHRPLLLLASGQRRDGIAAVRAATNARSQGLRLAAAAKLAAEGDRETALTLLDGRDPVLAAARARVAAGKPLPGAIDTPAAGIAELFVRVAVDINHERPSALALTLARLSTFLMPQKADAWLASAQMLATAGHTDAALAALRRISADDPAADAARLARLDLLVHKGEQKEALDEALTAAAGPDATVADLSRVGDLLNRLDRHREAADAYTRALALAEKDPALADTKWTFLMLRGAALSSAGDWQAARTDLQRAVKLAPDQASALNFLGYTQLERRENLAQAEKLIQRASLLQPDDAAITDSLGWTYYLRGDLARAIATLERAVAGEPTEPTINEHLGDAYWTAGRRWEARYAWRAALVTADDELAARIRSKLDLGLSAESAAR